MTTVDQRPANVARFLAERGLDPKWLADLLDERTGPGEYLLTSSPVHGLANPSSDLDFIRIQPEPLSGTRIAAKLFEDGHHLEVVSFSADEVTRNLAELQRLASAAPAESVAGFRTWDKRLEPRRKQTERIVNGVTLAGELPYRDALPALGAVWSRASLQTAAEHAVHLCLAEAAGEQRGRVGYAVNAVLHLADALLSASGDVYTTRKWFLLRWARARLAETTADPAIRAAAAAVDRLRQRALSALDTSVPPLAPDVTATVDTVARVIGVAGRVEVAVGLAGGVRYQPYLAGSGLLVGSDASLVVDEPGPPEPVRGPLRALGATVAGTAPTLLRVLRGGLGTLEVSYPDAPPGDPVPAPQARAAALTEADPVRVAARLPVFPGVRAGHARPAAATVAVWLQVGWLMLAEGLAYIEDLAGGREQPQMQQAAKIRLLEQLADIDSRLAGRLALADQHCLAVALEYGFSELVAASGADLAEVFALGEELGGAQCTVAGVELLWQRLVDGFPGDLPDRLVAQGHRDLLVTLRSWAELARSVDLDVGLLAPLIKDA
jgi:hypothetical protein